MSGQLNLVPFKSPQMLEESGSLAFLSNPIHHLTMSATNVVASYVEEGCLLPKHPLYIWENHCSTSLFVYLTPKKWFLQVFLWVFYMWIYLLQVYEGTDIIKSYSSSTKIWNINHFSFNKLWLLTCRSCKIFRSLFWIWDITLTWVFNFGLHWRATYGGV